MILLTLNNQAITQQTVTLALLTNQPDNQSDNLAQNPIYQFVDNHQSDNTTDLSCTYLSYLDEINEFMDKTRHVLLTTDNTTDDLDKLSCNALTAITFFVNDFKDGRTFSLIRYLRNIGFLGDIYLLGNYGLDQAGYYHKSGATGFFVQETHVATLLKTLTDLKSGHLGKSANALPMFQ